MNQPAIQSQIADARGWEPDGPVERKNQPDRALGHRRGRDRFKASVGSHQLGPRTEPWNLMGPAWRSIPGNRAFRLCSASDAGATLKSVFATDSGLGRECGENEMSRYRFR